MATKLLTVSLTLQTNPIWTSCHITDKQRAEIASLMVDDGLKLRLLNILHTIWVRNENLGGRYDEIMLRNPDAIKLACEYLGISEPDEKWFAFVESMSDRFIMLRASTYNGNTERKTYRGLFFSDDFNNPQRIEYFNNLFPDQKRKNPWQDPATGVIYHSEDDYEWKQYPTLVTNNWLNLWQYWKGCLLYLWDLNFFIWSLRSITIKKL